MTTQETTAAVSAALEWRNRAANMPSTAKMIWAQGIAANFMRVAAKLQQECGETV